MSEREKLMAMIGGLPESQVAEVLDFVSSLDTVEDVEPLSERELANVKAGLEDIWNDLGPVEGPGARAGALTFEVRLGRAAAKVLNQMGADLERRFRERIQRLEEAPLKSPLSKPLAGHPGLRRSGFGH